MRLMLRCLSRQDTDAAVLRCGAFAMKWEFNIILCLKELDLVHYN